MSQQIQARKVSVAVAGLGGIDMQFSGHNVQDLILEIAHRVLDLEEEIRVLKTKNH